MILRLKLMALFIVGMIASCDLGTWEIYVDFIVAAFIFFDVVYSFEREKELRCQKLVK